LKPRLRSVVVAVLAASQPAFAQQAVEKVERIEVTGSRIAISSSDVDSPSPIAIINAKDIKIEGYQNLELILNNYPQFVPDQGNRISNGATGTATANLRGLGAGRTLVLLNGKRMPPGNPFVLSPDLNQIPPQLIQRVEVLTGGASAVYGSDAIAGVVNFILNDHFEGVQGDVSYDFFSHSQKNGVAQNMLAGAGYSIPSDKFMDGESGSASLTLGGNFANDKGNAVVSFRYFKSKALQQSDRDYSACPITFPLDEDGNFLTTPQCAGSSVNATGRFQDLGYFRANPGYDDQGTGRVLTLDPGTGRIRRFTPADLYNFAPTNYYQRPQERYGFNTFVNYDVAPAAKVYMELGYHDDRSVAQIAPSAIFFYESNFAWENPLLTDEWRSRFIFRNPDGSIGTGPGTVANLSVSRRNVDGGPRQDDLHHQSFREVVGVKGQFGANWDYDIYHQYGRVNYDEQYFHDFSVTRIARALDVVSDPVTGTPVCRSVVNGIDRNCVPFNLWTLNGVTPAALAYLEVAPIQKATMSQQVIGGTATSNLGPYGIRFPGSSEAAEIAIGLERRTERLDFEASQEFTNLSGFGLPILPVKAELTIKDIFTELRLPVRDLLNISGSYRHSDHDSGLKTNTYGIGFNTAPVKSIRFRGSYQKAVRAPDLNELYQPQVGSGYDLDGSVDPCAGASPTRSLQDCQRTGVTAAQYGRIPQSPGEGFPSTVGGNSRLKAETANTYTVGLVAAPSKDLSVTVDYFDIRIDDTISTSIDGGVLFNECLNTGDPVFCKLVTRDAASGSLWYGSANVDATNRNIGKTQTSGTDVSVNYRLRLPNGHNVLFDGLGSYLSKSTIQIYPHAPTENCAGYFQTTCANMPLPRWRHRLRGTWQPPGSFELSATWRYFGSATLAIPDTELLVTHKVPPMNYLDLAGSWNITKAVTLRGGIANVTDRDPPLVIGPAPGVNGNSYSQLYDVLGRHYFATLTAKF
jgi:iron complex outermembrane receptor protein